MTKSHRGPVREPAAARVSRLAAPRHAGSTAARAAAVNDAFFRQVVASMRNGVLAFTRDGKLTLINHEAYSIFDIAPEASDVGRPVSEVLQAHPEVVRVLHNVFDVHLLPNRAELRLRPSGKVIGY